MSERPGDRNRRRKHEHAHVNGGPGHGEGLSLKGEEGRQVALNLARLALGQTTIKELNDSRYTLTREGTVSLHLDAESIAALEEVERQ